MDKETRILVAKRSAQHLEGICDLMLEDPEAYLEVLEENETREMFLIERVKTLISHIKEI